MAKSVLSLWCLAIRQPSLALHLAVEEKAVGLIDWLLALWGKTLLESKHCVGCSQSSTPLHKAVLAGDINLTEKLLQAGADPNCENSLGSTPLVDAAALGFASHCSLLIEHGADVNKKDRRNNLSPLHMACLGSTTGHTAAVRVLLLSNANPCHITDTFHTPLHFACRTNNEATLDLLLRFHPELDINCCTIALPHEVSQTPLYCAFVGGHWALAERLMARGAKLGSSQHVIAEVLSYCRTRQQPIDTLIRVVLRLVRLGAEIDDRCAITACLDELLTCLEAGADANMKPAVALKLLKRAPTNRLLRRAALDAATTWPRSLQELCSTRLRRALLEGDLTPAVVTRSLYPALLEEVSFGKPSLLWKMAPCSLIEAPSSAKNPTAAANFTAN